MLTCDKCGAKGFIAVEEDEFHCLRCGLVWYLKKRRTGSQRKREKGRKAAVMRRAPEAKEGCPWPGVG